ncbi:hypothetical protein TWF730_007110 [Orbilia blumenaviensis]|uniref:Uncharacterized protein n=1 Tax=Orbilia blumenaviensis TaxID=1796055 RepID=A0AAV9VG99_9PEZI
MKEEERHHRQIDEEEEEFIDLLVLTSSVTVGLIEGEKFRDAIGTMLCPGKDVDADENSKPQPLLPSPPPSSSRDASPRPAYQPHRRPSLRNILRAKNMVASPFSPAGTGSGLSSLASVTNMEEYESEEPPSTPSGLTSPRSPQGQSTTPPLPPPPPGYSSSTLTTSPPPPPLPLLPTSDPSENAGTPHIYGDIIRTIHFYRPPRYNSPPRFLVAHPNGSGIKNFSTLPKKTTMHDIRNKEHRFHLGLHSFKPLRHLPPLPYPLDLTTPGTLPQITTSITDLIKRHVPSPNKITIFSTTILRPTYNNNSSIGTPSPKLAHPAQIDQTPASALQRAQRHLPKSLVSQITSGTLSLRIINIYRPLLPLHNTLQDHPLYISESQTISDSDLVLIEHVYPDRVGATYAVKHSQGQRFWYWSDMDATEGFIVQVYDSMYACDLESGGGERSVRAATGFFRLMPQGWEEGCEGEWLVVRALVVA